MEVACELIKKNQTIDLKNNSLFENINKFEFTEDDKKSRETFLRKLTSKKYTNIIKNITNELFDNYNNDLNNSFSFAYYFAYFGNDIFDKKKSDLERKLLNKAKKVILEFENIRKKGKLSKIFFDIYDNYYSLYKTWTSIDKIEKLEGMLLELVELHNCYNCKSLDKNKDKILINMEQIGSNMFDIDGNFTTKIFLNNYELFYYNNKLKNKFWLNILDLFKNEYKRDSLILIMVAELRIKMIPKLKNSKDRKNIYYNIDVEELSNKLRHNKLYPQKLIEIIKIFSNKLININKNFEPISFNHNSSSKWSNKFSIDIIKSFRNMFDSLFKNIYT